MLIEEWEYECRLLIMEEMMKVVIVIIKECIVMMKENIRMKESECIRYE